MKCAKCTCTFRCWVSYGRWSPHPSYQAHQSTDSTPVHYCLVGNQASLTSSSNFSRVQKSGVLSDIYKFSYYSEYLFQEGISPTMIFLSFLGLSDSEWYPGATLGRRQAGSGGQREIQTSVPKGAQHLWTGGSVWTLNTAFSYISWCYRAHKYRLRKRTEFVFVVFPMMVAVGNVFWVYGPWKTKKIYGCLKIHETVVRFPPASSHLL